MDLVAFSSAACGVSMSACFTSSVGEGTPEEAGVVTGKSVGEEELESSDEADGWLS